MLFLKNLVRSLLPDSVLSAYHFSLSFLAALIYGFPSSRLAVIAVTGTKGKSSTLEFANAIFEEAGYKTALASTIRLKIGEKSEPNLMRMTMAGRFFIQRFLDKASRAGCSVVLLEMTSEGARQYRHRFIELDALIFTNLAPEHIESHGSLQAYAAAKLEIGNQLARSRKRPRYMVSNSDDDVGARFLALNVEYLLPYSLSAAEPYTTGENGSVFRFGETDIYIHLPGTFSVLNAFAAATLTRAIGIAPETIARGLSKIERIPGRAERIEAGQNFLAVVDYAHTPDSLKAIYNAYPNRRRICVLGSTGGGRDTWKRPVMGEIADEMCERVILTNEDPYDEDPRSIVDALASGMKRKKPDIVMDRREAIRAALSDAQAGDVVLVTGKGTDPNICGPRGTKEPWSDASVVREELLSLRQKQ